MKPNELVELQREYYLGDNTLSYEFRMGNLVKLEESIKKNEKRLIEALKADLNKSEFESFLTEIGSVYTEISYAKKHLKKWMKPTKVKTPITLFLASSKIYHEPYGVTLIIAPWNYPVNLFLNPLIGAIAAGNTCILKPSELSSNTSSVLTEMINETFEERYIHSVEGDASVVEEILKNKFDLIFYTGGSRVGKIIMNHASDNLTPVVLELGGKSPCIVTKNADIKLTSKRILFGKLLNAGQTCVAPDYVYCDETIKNELIEELKNAAKELYLEDSDFPNIINQRHLERLKCLIDDSKICYQDEGNKLRLTILDNVTFEDKVMQEEIFGPILPIISYSDINSAYATLKHLEKPLALYIFSNNKKEQAMFLNLNFGGGLINDTIMHLVSPYLPFGGAGNSGMGSYHGKFTFDCFSREKSICNRSTKIDMKVRYTPYTEKKKKFIRNIYK